MKQVIQNYGTGKLKLAEVPVPVCLPDRVLIKNTASLISLGTERSVIELARKNLIEKAKERPELVKRFFEKVKNEGLVKTFKEALERLDTPIPLGYSTSGLVLEIGNNIRQFSAGDRVACIGAGFASHSEYIQVPESLCCKIPEDVDYDEAAFGMLGTIALHGVRCANIAFGETVAVFGLGVLGLLTAQILKSYGSRVIGVDLDRLKVDLAKSFGIDLGIEHDLDKSDNLSLKKACELFTSGCGVDSVILTLSTKESRPVDTAIDILRFKGKMVLVGVADIHPNRNEMWKKEVELVVSRAGGPGSLDPLYEAKGIDYPIGYVRWTENRNLEEFLRLASERKINLKKMISHRYSINNAEEVYKNILENKHEHYIGILFEYPTESKIGKREIILKSDRTRHESAVSLGVIGAGVFGKSVFLPILSKASGINLETIATSTSVSNYHSGKKFGFRKCTTDYTEIMKDKNINTLVILTPHSLHANMVTEGLLNNKHVFVEKPLCITQEELEEIVKIYKSLDTSLNKPFLMVGYNRRFSPHSRKVIEILSDRKEPVLINYQVNAGYIPSSHWVHLEEEGGGRVIGEICHFVDLLQFITRSKPLEVFSQRISSNNKTSLNSDNCVVVVKFDDGSIGNIFYTASGDRAYPREKVEIFCEGKTIVMNDFKETVIYSFGKKETYRTFNQEIGHKEEIKHFIDVIMGKEKSMISFEEIVASTLSVFKINESLAKDKYIKISM